MIEAVGHQYFDEFFARCAQRLEPGGTMLLQAITIADRHYARARGEVDFIKRHIFPGSCIPSVSALAQAMASAATCVSCTWRTSARTTRPRWPAGGRISRAIWTSVRALGLPETFIRMWEFYFCYCEAGFAERALGDVQILLAREG